MKKRLLLFVLIFSSVFTASYCQNPNTDDTLSINRGILGVKVYHNNFQIDHKLQKLYFNNNLISYKKNNWSDFLMISSPIVTITGIYLVVDGLIGKTMYHYEGNERIQYKDRSLPKLCGGIFLIVGGGVMFEYSKDLKISAVKNFNQGKSKGKLSLKVKVSSDAKVGLYARID